MAEGLEGRGAVVTGAAGGIGRAVSEAFAASGARVMAGPVVFLASDHARYITGATLNVSGGLLMY